MPYPQLHDDGTSVTLDLHGTSVDEALNLVRRLVVLASRRGRHSIKILHGSSTSQQLYRNRTIKHALHDLLDQDGLSPSVISTFRAEEYLVVSLDITHSPSPDNIQLRDIQ